MIIIPYKVECQLLEKEDIMKAITNGTIMTITKGVIPNGTVLIKDKKIVAVGENVPVPEGCEIIDAHNGIITPGLIDCHTHISTFGELKTMPGLQVDGNEGSDPITPHVRALDAIYPEDPAIAKARAAGFTTVYTGPGSANVIGGTGIAMKLRGHTAEEMVIPGTEAMKFALGENPKRFYGLERKTAPWTRMGTAAILREALYNAKNYADKLDEAKNDPDKSPDRDFKLDALVPVVRGKQRVRIHCHRADDIATAIRIGKEYGLDFTLEHATEGYLVKDLIAENHLYCVVGPLLLDPLKQEVWGLKLETAGILTDAGIKVCLTADTSGGTAWLPVEAGLLTRRGLSEEDALRGLTIYPAEVLKLDHRIGSIEQGKDADIAIFDGNPLSSLSLCQMTMIEGEIVFRRGRDV